MNVQALIPTLEDLPPAPVILSKLAGILANPDQDASDIAALVAMDTSLTAQLLKLSNSAAYAPKSPIVDLEDAISRLGLMEVCHLVVLIAGGPCVSRPLPAMGLEDGQLWEHCLATAILMEELPLSDTLPTGLPYTLGLLHDIGKIVLQSLCADSYPQIFTLLEEEGLSLAQAEEQVLGVDHAEAGAILLETWKFPPMLTVPVRFQHRPLQAGANADLACALHLANWGTGILGCHHGRDAWAIPVMEEASLRLEMDEKTLELAILAAKEKLQKVRHQFRPSSSL